MSMGKRARRVFSPEFKREAVARLSAPGATQSSVAAEFGIAANQLRTWRLELEASGSAEAMAHQKAEAAELQRLRRENARLREENEILQKASAFFARRADKA